ncbi:hypothetical protein [Jannaschia aquimarina]|uniref:Uncharacterized protein n=1 Tax=Jannaschia aquimarina TaxID=935700 RepID=A0A0D1EL16_9RHOB|nr:hypothetical protein [Jannaschia aquimarina]KIT16435.1 hypothetical protein jaqu_18220 [Jannaschia aquimarina]SNS92258.1 hypothetical protein SAMN05421775_103322 [Jannaschia aquimarina]
MNFRATIETAALGAALLWLVIGGWVLFAPSDEGSWIARADPIVILIVLLGLMLPLALCLLVISATRRLRELRGQTVMLRRAVDNLRMSYLETRDTPQPDLVARLDGLDRLRTLLETRIATEARPAAQAAPARSAMPAPQPALALETGAREDELTPAELVRALHFPDNENDTEGFDVLRRALRHPPTAQVVSAAQDALTLLSQDGIYVDDFDMDAQDPSIWRAFADGTRGAETNEMGAIHDRSALALASARMRDDPEFRETAHRFLMAFDRMLADLVERADDEDFAALSRTRSARAFMLLGRVAGTFG